MLAYGLLIWVWISAKMPAGYFVACWLGVAIKALDIVIDTKEFK